MGLAAAVMSEAGVLSELRCLSLAENAITDDGFEARASPASPASATMCAFSRVDMRMRTCRRGWVCLGALAGLLPGGSQSATGGRRHSQRQSVAAEFARGRGRRARRDPACGGAPHLLLHLPQPDRRPRLGRLG